MGETRNITNKGYIRVFKKKKHVFEHVLVWERNFGKIPDGMQIHHKDFNKTNNSIENLQLVSPIEHKRIHSGCKYVDGVWFKPCKKCGEFKECNENNWYYSRGWINGKLCKECFIEKSIETRNDLIRKGWKRKNYPIKKISSNVSK